MKQKRKGKPKQQKSNVLFDVLNDIKLYKKGNLLNDEKTDSSVSNFMLLRFLSMDNDINLEICSMINQYQGMLSKKQMYKFLIEIIPKSKSFDKYISNKLNYEKGIEKISRYLEISKKEASAYFKSHPDFCKQILIKYGGKDKHD